ncbi:C4-dicarboxylate ABC transporter [Arenicella chitinivorans]|uniref:TRAP transporter large permease protein n=1 Tax=Arenicella chitinivorans TaxID=1329800 RepID=A0A918RY46_9GAMM|nr:TRAP transporter large permease subunit [Arenicella chitinivorans]GHA16911.1 C4-dicarboxylate ABC transporter [Arenicella chitinivorans]
MHGITIFIVALLFLLFGYPVAFTFAGIGIAFVVLFADANQLAQIPYRIYANMGDNGEGLVLMAVPLFIFMGIILQRTKLAEQLLESMGQLFGAVRGGLAISTVLVGALLAASTGVVGASVVAMGLISLPVMMRYGYKTELATGTIAASGTLGQIIPPSIVLIILADVLSVPVGDLFKAALIPGLVLIGCYILYILVYCRIKPDAAPVIDNAQSSQSRRQIIATALLAVIPPLALILIVLGSIFNAVATPTESSALGCVGAILLAILYGKFSLRMLWESAHETVKITAMVFAVLLGASIFSMGFSYTGGEHQVEQLLLSIPGEKWGFLIAVMLLITLLGFFLDYIEISYIVLPLVYAVVLELGINQVWFAILVAMNLQTSFLTPPFGFALFYLKGVAPNNVQTAQIYRGAIPFILIQLLILATMLVFPHWYGMSAEQPSLW